MNGGMYWKHILDDGEQVANPVSITKRNWATSAFPGHGDSSKYAWSVANSNLC